MRTTIEAIVEVEIERPLTDVWSGYLDRDEALRVAGAA